ncbi:MAG TPA: ABC transporter permease [Gemmatimonas sp.]|uniref:ABC transporter permease n=1 Tax=Gemmatimonas sp. TaxID=1962908 RepID=UPI002ED952C1
MSAIDGLRARLALLFSRTHSDARFNEEIAFHIEMETARLEREEGLPHAEARRRALIAFGGVEVHKEALRDGRGLRWLGGLTLDLKLGIRMLLKYPGLTLIGGLAFAFAIWVAAGAFEFAGQALFPRLPLPDANRVVAIESWDAAAGRAEPRVLHDFTTWRTELRSVTELGAYRVAQRNLVTSNGESQPTEVAEISAAAFRIAPDRPLYGRVLTDADELPAAPAVAVIGYDVWQHRFNGDPTVVGRVVQLGRTPTTVVGVMPEGFGFPVAQSLWVPLRLSPLDYARGDGPSLHVFGKLATGVTLAEAQTELTALGRRAAADFPVTHQHLRPRVMPYAESVALIDGSELFLARSSYGFFLMLVLLVCGNVALLMFARAATRERELVVRHALGATRGRILAQLFAEALVLCGVAAAVGLGVARLGVRLLVNAIETNTGQPLPFWFHAELSPWTVLYAVGLTVLGAGVAGVIPGLKVTRGLEARLRQAAAGAGGLTFGGIWTAVIVAQIAVTLGFPVVAYSVARDAADTRAMVADFPAAEYLSARIALDRDLPPGADTSFAAFAARRQTILRELERRLLAESGVVGVTLADRLPRMDHPPRMIDVDAGGAAPENPGYPGGYRTSSAEVDVDYFDVLGARVLAGRAFQESDMVAGTGPAGVDGDRSRVVMVNESFVRLVLGGRNPIGRRLRNRYDVQRPRSGEWEPGPWHEIVGVVPDLGMSKASDPKVAGIYRPLATDADVPLYVAVHVRGDAAAFGPRLRAVASAVDPTLRIDNVARMDTLSDPAIQFMTFWVRLVSVVSVVALLLSMAGIYAVMSFTVARRTREIGIRVALGATPRRVVAAVFARPLKQVALGVVAGGVLTAITNDDATPRALAGTLLYSVFMLAVCLIACIVPTWRALRIQPTEALRADG